MGRYSTFFSKEEHRVAIGALFYKIEGEKHCVIRKAILEIKSLHLCLHNLDYIITSINSIHELSLACSDQPVSCTPSDTRSKEKSVVENSTSLISTEAIRRSAILFPSKACYTRNYGLHTTRGCLLLKDDRIPKLWWGELRCCLRDC